MLFLIFREKKLKIQLFRLKQISSLNQWRLLWWQWFFIRRKWCWGSTSKHTTQFPFHSTKNKKWENGEDIEQGSSLAVVFNQSKKNWSNKNVFLSCETWNVEFVVCEKWNSHFIFHQTWSIPNLVGRVLSYPPLRRRENLGTRLINTTPPPPPLRLASSPLPPSMYYPSVRDDYQIW